MRNIFRKKAGTQEQVPQAAPRPESKEQVAESEIEEETPRQKMQRMAGRERELSGEPDRPEKTCQKCGAPNDVFVEVCWMCKERV